MAEPRPEPEVGVEIVEVHDMDACTWTADVDEKRRAFVVNQMANCDVDGKVLVENMHAVCEWLKSGQVPTQTSDKPFDTKGARVRMDVVK